MGKTSRISIFGYRLQIVSSKSSRAVFPTDHSTLQSLQYVVKAARYSEVSWWEKAGRAFVRHMGCEPQNLRDNKITIHMLRGLLYQLMYSILFLTSPLRHIAHVSD